MSDDKPKANPTVEGYNLLAENKDRVGTSPWGESDYQRHYVWPGVRPLLPDVARKRVFDAGCGIGDYTEWFLEHGAEVVGVDASSRAIAIAKSRLGHRADFHCTDLTNPLEFTAQSEFDLVFSNLVLGHIEHWRPVFEEFRRILTTDGTFVFTAIHPVRRYRRHRDELASYYDIDSYTLEWGDTGATVEQYHRPISEIVNSLSESGFRLDEFREITPQEDYRECNPDRYERALKEPDTLCVRARPFDAEQERL
ncbi:class I SAM-dependent methyltransferase [Natrialba sp. SSL1]|uniref:class I SAM-dependent methyltransferase n=1 Tax=Natrialba sp. SSL1 TaxID=1869245 RepID=UPI0008F94F45|nr:class I SAM-dependent methyltransferase [Natrialba sp. SSL1]OIB58739.1 methyltransferase [Natrialba sp. SSL1]